MKKIYNIICFVFGFLFLTSCTSSQKQGTLSVVVTSNPNQNLIKYIAQDKADLYSLVFNSSSHDFEVKPEDIRRIEEADVVFYNGLGLDDKVLEFSNDKSKFIKTTDGVTLIELQEEHSHNHDEEENNHENNENAADNHTEETYYDPHVWLSLKEYKIMAKNVLDKLVELDPVNEEFYVKNYNDFVVRADSIYETYKRDFDTLTNKEFVSNHASYGYLARDFGLINSSLYDINNHGEANPQDIQTIVDVIREKNIKLIIGDEFDSNKELETISNETGVNYKVVNNLESKGDFFTEYEKLLSSIYDGLK
ncbi:metal ABC transporter substrate-binding protein [Candidatus Arthromitus sp. SFB-turkey]|uniref:metal ABC transporter substrate-binding protein n=1 Tax=Candidatus Arthromitus sp. SFB-turkey TaxID=1840217 RepID=UPI0007F49878|nr:metal ABC transporter substrate-binding protein [Candidatus Arthromitus sp. SFB-turkey]OAT86964.1 ABC transporter substrate-binding protein [Candidatus Arthromitus sp. SFB-turkey]